MVSGGSLYRLYSELEGNVLSSQNVVFVLGMIRVCVWPEEEWFLNDVSLFVRKEENGIDDARSAMLSLFTESLLYRFKEYDSTRTIRLSVLRVFEQFQDDLMCKNFCLHLLDLVIATLFPQIEVWSHLAETHSDDDSVSSDWTVSFNKRVVLKLLEKAMLPHKRIHKLVGHERNRGRRHHSHQICEQSTVKPRDSFTSIRDQEQRPPLPNLHRTVQKASVRRLRVQLLHPSPEHLQRVGDHGCAELGNAATVQTRFVVLRREGERK